MIRCSSCLATMRRPDWDVHNCPATPAILAGESWADFKARSEAHAAAWREAQSAPQAPTCAPITSPLDPTTNPGARHER
jgi:broad specificity phosphatase PhoE